MIDLIVHKQNEEIKERLARLEEKMDKVLSHFGYEGVIKHGEGIIAIVKDPQPEDDHIKAKPGEILVHRNALRDQTKEHPEWTKFYQPEDEHYFVQEELKPTPKKKGK